MKNFHLVTNSGERYNSVNIALSRAIKHIKPVVSLGTGVFNEKVYSKFKNLQIIGEGQENTIITNSVGAYCDRQTGEKTGTFRSFTACFQGDSLYLDGFTIENTCGDGRIAGQGIALYLDCKYAYLKNMRITGHQDTLFFAPLPERPRIPGSFKGPGFNKKRRTTVTYLENCYIEGDIDFIFGGGEAVFENCRLHSLDRKEKINGYISAPSTPAGKKGFTFYHCLLTGAASKESVYLGRPWRPDGNAVFLECQIGGHVAKEGWTLWNYCKGEEQTVRFGTYPLLSPNEPDWSMKLTSEVMPIYTEYISRTKEFLLNKCK